VAVSCRSFGTTHRFHLQGGPIGYPEISVNKNYHYSLRNNPEECSSQILRGGSLKSHIVTSYFGFKKIFPYDVQTGCCGQHKLATCVVCWLYYLNRSISSMEWKVMCFSLQCNEFQRYKRNEGF
jgi:hypothetical protein